MCIICNDTSQEKDSYSAFRVIMMEDQLHKAIREYCRAVQGFSAKQEDALQKIRYDKFYKRVLKAKRAFNKEIGSREE